MRDGSRHVFVGGLHRSGTTPLARLLGQHPEISGLTGTGVSEDEGQHLQDVYAKIRAHGGMGRFANTQAAHLTARSPLVSAANADRLVDAWSPYWDDRRRLLLEKSPANLIMTTFLEALFPGAAFIVVVRHPIAVALAMQKWNPTIVARNGRRRTSLSGLVSHWLAAHALLRADAPQVGRLHVVRYEDLVADPQSRLAQIGEFLRLRSPLEPSGLRGGMSSRYQQDWDAMRRSPLRRHLRRRIEERYAEDVAAYGYDLERVVEPSAPLDTVALFRH